MDHRKKNSREKKRESKKRQFELESVHKKMQNKQERNG